MPTAIRTSRKRNGRMARLAGVLPGPAMILPAVVALGIFQFLPLVVAVVNSFRSFNPFNQSPTGWVGLANYDEIFSDPGFQLAFVNTIAYIVIMLAATIPLALFLAVLLDQRLPGSTFARGAIVAALAASEAVSALIWNQLYDPRGGMFNAILAAVGLPEQPFLIGDTQSLLSIAAMSVWKDVGLPMLIFLAGLQAIPRELYEAAALDGAGPWRTFRNVTLPLLRPSLVVALFMMTITATRIFTPILILTQGGPNGATSNLAYYSYRLNFEFMAPGAASASVVCMLLVIVVITIAQTWLARGPKGV